MAQPRRPSWETARHLLARFDGAASELFVIDLPREAWRQVVARLARLPRLEVLAFAGDSFGEAHDFDSAWYERLATQCPDGTFHALRSADGSHDHLQVYLWTPTTSTPVFELELVFWNDLTFPESVDDAERARRLDRLVDIAEDCRLGVVDARCILTDEHNGDPKDLVGQDGVIVW